MHDTKIVNRKCSCTLDTFDQTLIFNVSTKFFLFCFPTVPPWRNESVIKMKCLKMGNETTWFKLGNEGVVKVW